MKAAEPVTRLRLRAGTGLCAAPEHRPCSGMGRVVVAESPSEGSSQAGDTQLPVGTAQLAPEQNLPKKVTAKPSSTHAQRPRKKNPRALVRKLMTPPDRDTRKSARARFTMT